MTRKPKLPWHKRPIDMILIDRLEQLVGLLDAGTYHNEETENDQDYLDGHSARLSGKRKIDCPFDSDDERSFSWLNGWKDAGKLCK